MSKISDYTVITDTDLSTLEREVKRSIEFGWQPLGTMSVIITKTSPLEKRFYQPMVSYEEQ